MSSHKPSPKPSRQPEVAIPSVPEAKTLFNTDEYEPNNKDKKKKGWFGWGNKKEAVKKESNLSCLCGAHLIYLDVKQAYKGKKVYCDICSKVCKESIFHCPAGDICC